MVTKYTMTLKSHIQRKNNDTRSNMKISLATDNLTHTGYKLFLYFIKLDKK